MLLLWLLISVMMIAVALVLSRSGTPGTCMKSLPAVCAHAAEIHPSPNVQD
jgi:hypothetical protein